MKNIKKIKQKIRDIFNNPNSPDYKKNISKLANDMVLPIRRHMEFCAIGGGLSPFQKYYVYTKNKRLIQWKPYKHGYFFDTISTLKDGRKVLNPFPSK